MPCANSTRPRVSRLRSAVSAARLVGAQRAGLVICLALVFALSACSSPLSVEPADLVLRGGNVVSVDAALPRAEAIAIRGFEIAAVGSNRAIDAYIGPATEVIELEGRLAIPGFIDAHVHFLDLGDAKTILDLTRATSWDEIVEQVRVAAERAKPGDWILGGGWHQEKWSELPEPNVGGVPLHHALSSVSPDNPVQLMHSSGHAVFVNAAALKLADINSDTPDPPGGEIVRDADGHPTGMLGESAEKLIRALIEQSDRERPAHARDAELRRRMQLAAREALSKGITSIQDAGSTFDEIDQYKIWAAEGALPVRVYAMVSPDESNDTLSARLADYRIIPEGNAFLAVRGIKRMLDGGLGAHGAWLLSPYTDTPDSTGLVLDPPENIERTGRIALRHGFQLNTHAIGDRANREILDVYQRIFDSNPSARDLRWRIEHAQHLDPADVPRFAQLGVIASMQGVHATSDGPWLPKRLGEKRAGEISYVWRSLIDAGARVSNGTDAPVEDIDPIASFYASVARKMANGEYFHPEQSMTRMEALRSYTIDSAYAAFEEHLKGSLAPGKLADISVLSKDILTIPADEIPSARVDYTIVGGKIAYSRATHEQPVLVPE